MTVQWSIELLQCSILLSRCCLWCHCDGFWHHFPAVSFTMSYHATFGHHTALLCHNAELWHHNAKSFHIDAPLCWYLIVTRILLHSFAHCNAELWHSSPTLCFHNPEFDICAAVCCHNATVCYHHQQVTWLSNHAAFCYHSDWWRPSVSLWHHYNL